MDKCLPQATRRSCMWRIGICIFIFPLLVSSILFHSSGRSALAAPTHHAGTVGGCPTFPANNIWNQDISNLPVHPNSANYIASIGPSNHIQNDFGSGLWNGGPIGIPYVVVPGNQPKVPVTFDYAGESDPGPYPIPPNAPIEGGPNSTGDRHTIVVDSATCKLYELFAAYPQSDGSWKAGSGAVWDLNSNALRPRSWTSSDAAGLSIFAGLVRYDEVAAGAITHALRFTIDRTQQAYIWPARHFASSITDPNVPPMGLRLRLKASFDISSFPPQARIVLTALKHYGMILADNGSCCFMSGAPDERWNNDDLLHMKSVLLSNFEAVDESSQQVNPDSGQAAGAPAAPVVPTAAPTPTAAATATATPTPTPTPTPTMPVTHGKVTISVSTATPLANAVTQEQKRNATVARPGEQKNWLSTALPISGAVVVLLLLVGGWLRFRRAHDEKRE